MDGMREPVNSAPNGGRQPDGRFAVGNRLAKGNPLAKRMHALRSAFLDAVTAADVRAVATSLLAQAKEGDVMASRLYLEYSLGRPAQALELTGADGEPLGIGLQALQTAILEALAPFAEARIAVALKLKELVRAEAEPGMESSRDVADPRGAGDGA